MRRTPRLCPLELWPLVTARWCYRSRQLWVGGERAARAHANPANCSGGPAFADMPLPPFATLCDGTFRAGTRTAAGYAGVPDRWRRRGTGNVSMVQWLTPGSELVFGRGGSGASWTEPRCTVVNATRGKTPGTVDILMAQPCWTRATSKHAAEQDVTFPSDIENAFDLLDEPGEWFADFRTAENTETAVGSARQISRASRTVFYIPRDGEDLSRATVVLGGQPTDGGGSALKVLPGAALKSITNVGFEYQTWLEPSSPGGFVDLNFGFFFVTPTAVDANVPNSVHGIPAVLTLTGARGVTVSNCSFRHLGLSGVVADGGSQTIAVTTSTFEDLSGSAIILGNVSDPVPPAQRMDTRINVSDNTIANTAAEYHGAAAVFAGYVSHVIIVSAATPIPCFNSVSQSRCYSNNRSTTTSHTPPTAASCSGMALASRAAWRPTPSATTGSRIQRLCCTIRARFTPWAGSLARRSTAT